MGITFRIRVNSSFSRRAWTNLALASSGLLVAIIGQRAMFGESVALDAALYFGLALTLAGMAWRGRAGLGTSRPVPAPRRAGVTPFRWPLLVLAIALALITFAFSARNTFTVLNVTAWWLSILVFLVAFWEAPSPGWGDRLLSRLRTFAGAAGVRLSWHLIAVLGVLGFALFFSFFELQDVPAEMTSDHAEKILDTYDVLHGLRPIFFPRNTGREPLQFYLNATIVALGVAPLDHIALKLVTASAGFLAVPFIYLLGRELFNSATGLLAAFLAGVSIWPVAIARVGLRFPFAPLFVAATFYFFVRALRYGRRNDFLLTGLVLGIGQYGYSPFRFAALAVGAILALWPLFQWRTPGMDWRRYVLNGLLLIALSILVFVPLGRYAADNPDMFLFRALSRVGTTEKGIDASPFTIFLDNTRRALLMFNGRGDTVWVNTIPNDPVVDYITGALIVLGAGYSLFRLGRDRDWRMALLWVGALVMMLPSTLAIAFPNENPSVVRSGGAIPFVMILAALPLAAWWQNTRVAGIPRLGLGALAILLLLVARVNYVRYFVFYDDQFRRSSWNSSEVGSVLREFTLAQGDPSHAYLISFPHWVDHRNVGIHFVGNPYWDNRVLDSGQLQTQAGEPGSKIYVLNKEDGASLALLKRLYPNGLVRLYPARTPTREFLVFTVLDNRKPDRQE